MRVLIAACLLSLALPGWASAETWTGKTRQGRGVVVHAGADGVVDRVRIGWTARCADGRYVSRTLFRAPLDTATPTRFADAGRYRAHPRGYRARIWVRIAGELHGETWHGTFRVRVRVTRRGRYVDACRLKRLKWSADPA